MAVHELTNDRWGFESNCFVCERRNEHGLRIPFFHDDEAGVVTAEVALGPEFSGVPQYLHGGIVLAVLDEAMAWATIAVANRYAVTREMTTSFARPVRVGRTYRVEARITSVSPERIDAEAVVVDDRGRTCTSAHADFFPLSEMHAVAAIGAELNEADAAFTEREPPN